MQTRRSYRNAEGTFVEEGHGEAQAAEPLEVEDLGGGEYCLPDGVVIMVGAAGAVRRVWRMPSGQVAVEYL